MGAAVVAITLYFLVMWSVLTVAGALGLGVTGHFVMGVVASGVCTLVSAFLRGVVRGLRGW
jgi:hypothetical protein